ncbi:MAG: nuclease-related domain-containing DEAD/DEAH box helicase [Synechococcales cyanobacterium]
MATMIPGSLPDAVSPGHKKLFKTLYYDLPDDFWVWYEPVVNRTRPDFLILGPTFGLVVIDVKEWSAEQIGVAASPDHLWLHQGGTSTLHTSPLIKCRAHLTNLVREFRHHPHLIQQQGDDQGRLAFSVGYGVIMAGMTRPEAEECGVLSLLPPPQVIYRDEFLRWDGQGERALVRRLEQLFSIPTWFDALTSGQMEMIRGIVHPETLINRSPSGAQRIGEAESAPKDKTANLIIKTLDRRQEALAKQILPGHSILYGVAGSGKTLILIARARILRQQDPSPRLLMLCFNITLAAYLRSMVHGDPQHPEDTAIEILHFNGWAKSLLGELPEIEDIPAGLTYDEHLTQLLLSHLQSHPDQRWDHILIDEGHTFDPGWFRCVVQALRPEGSLVIAADASQTLYPRPPFQWADVGIQADSQAYQSSFHLDVNYRNTQQILQAAWDVVAPVAAEANPAFPLLQPTTSMRQGKMPVLIRDPDLVLDHLVQWLQMGYRPRDIGILYRFAHQSMRHQLGTLMEGCRQRQIPFFWVTENEASKTRYSVHTPGIRFTTALSSLGLEFKVVVILAVEQFDHGCTGDPETQALTRKLLYVAMTRAQDILHVYGRPTSLMLQELAASHHWDEL